jgi:hypothetical protein
MSCSSPTYATWAARAAAGDDREIYILCPRAPEPESLAA